MSNYYETVRKLSLKYSLKYLKQKSFMAL